MGVIGLDWYDLVPADSDITQGDIVFDCVALEWMEESRSDRPGIGTEGPDDSIPASAARIDAIVMTQACDFEHDKTVNAIVCEISRLEEYYEIWRDDCEAQGNNPTRKAWIKHCEELVRNQRPNLAMLNRATMDGQEYGPYVVDFSQLFSVPVFALQKMARLNSRLRPRLLPPYREYLSQRFAMYFMRVGLPIDIDRDWGRYMRQ